jgi:HAD superfamily phosphatase (TIGR01668 family)
MFQPDLILDSVLELDLARLRSMGIYGLLLDVDGTLKPHYATEIEPKIAAWIRELKAEGIRFGFLSNGHAVRIKPLADSVEVPVFADACKPLPFACKRAIASLGLTPDRMLLVGDQLFTDVLCGKLAGMRTVFVTPMSSSEPIYTRIKRPIEWLLLRRAPRS